MNRVISDDLWGALTIYGEARGESYLGQVAVGEVIRTRTIRKVLSDGTIPGTVLKLRQFSCWCDGDPNRLAIASVLESDPAWDSCRQAWTESAKTIVTRGATHYLNPELILQQVGKLPSWAAEAKDPTQLARALVTIREGRHTFLKIL